MGILSWIILGLIAGVLAKWIMPGKDPGGFIITTLLGIGGAFVGGLRAVRWAAWFLSVKSDSGADVDRV